MWCRVDYSAFTEIYSEDRISGYFQGLYISRMGPHFFNITDFNFVNGCYRQYLSNTC